MPSQFRILVCRGPECGDKHHSADLHLAFEKELKGCRLEGNQVTLDLYSCFGKCQKGPNVLVREVLPTESTFTVKWMPTTGRRAVLYHGVQTSEVRRILEEHVVGGRRIDEFIERGAPPVAGVASK